MSRKDSPGPYQDAPPLPPQVFARIGQLDRELPRSWIDVGCDAEFACLVVKHESDDPTEPLECAHILLDYQDWLALRGAIDAVFATMSPEDRSCR